MTGVPCPFCGRTDGSCTFCGADSDGSASTRIDCPFCVHQSARQCPACMGRRVLVGYVPVLVSTDMIDVLRDWSEPIRARVVETPGVGSGYEMNIRMHYCPPRHGPIRRALWWLTGGRR